MVLIRGQFEFNVAGQTCWRPRWCKSEANCFADKREHPDDDQGPFPLAANLQGLCNPLLQGWLQLHQFNSSTRILLIFMKFSLHQERSKSDSGAAKVGEKRKPITFYSASEGTGAKQGKTGAAFSLGGAIFFSSLTWIDHFYLVGMSGKFGGMRMDGEGAGQKKKLVNFPHLAVWSYISRKQLLTIILTRGFVGRPSVSAYKPGGKVARPTGQYKACV